MIDIIVVTYNVKDKLLKGLKRFDEASIEFKRLLNPNPLRFQAHHQLASVYKKMGKIEESRRGYNNSIKYLSVFNLRA